MCCFFLPASSLPSILLTQTDAPYGRSACTCVFTQSKSGPKTYCFSLTQDRLFIVYSYSFLHDGLGLASWRQHLLEVRPKGSAS